MLERWWGQCSVVCYGGNKLCKWRLFTIFMAAITVSITGFLITPGYIYKHYPLVGFYHVISHFREGRHLGKSISILVVTGGVTHGAGEGR